MWEHANFACLTTLSASRGHEKGREGPGRKTGKDLLRCRSARALLDSSSKTTILRATVLRNFIVVPVSDQHRKMSGHVSR